MCCAAPAGVPRTRLALESRWILTIALSLKSLFTSARMSIIEATCATTSPELYLQCVADEQAGLSLGFDLANWTVPFSDFKDHTAEKLGRRGNQFTWWDLFKSAPDLVLKKFAEAELGDRMEKSEKSATLGADPKVEKKEKKKSFFGKKKEGGDGKELV